MKISKIITHIELFIINNVFINELSECNCITKVLK